MKIAIVGAGRVGSTLGNEGPRHLLRRAKPQATGIPAAAAFGQVVVLATPWHGTEAAVRAAGDLRGKTIIDCTNPLKQDGSGLELIRSGTGRSVGQGSESLQGVQHDRLEQHGRSGIRTVMFVCGDDQTARATVMQLAADIGFDTVDAGKLEQARLLEPLAMLWISLAYGGIGRDIGFALLRRGPTG